MFDAIDRESEEDRRARIDVDELEAHVDAFAGTRRYPGSDDQWAVAEYVVETLRDYGAAAELRSFDAYTSVPEDATVTVTTPRRRVLDDAVTVSFGASTPVGGVSGDLVRVEDLGGDLAKVAGEIAFVRGLPSPDPVRRLEAAGAQAVVFESPTPGQVHEMIVTPVWGTPEPGDVDDLPSLPVAEVYPDEGEWIRDRLAEGPVELTVETQTTTGVTELPCPVGRIEGSESDRYLLVGNHLDGWHEGVTDNGTAMAATLELARVFAADPPKRGLVFGFWPGHSMGRYAGSTRYADAEWLDLRDDGVAYLHLDLNGLRGAEAFWYQDMAEVAAEHRDAIDTASFPLMDGGGGDDNFLGETDRPGRNSDQSFWGAGLPSMLSGARLEAGTPEGGPIGGGWWWHTPEDTRERVDLDVLVTEVEAYAAVVSRFCDSPILPHDFAATVEEVRTVLSEVDPGSDAADFGPVYDRLDRLEALLDRANDALDDRATGRDGVFAAGEDLQVALGNALVPAVYVARSRFRPDPALSQPLLPSLQAARDLPEQAGRERLFTETAVRRARNRLADGLDEAAAAAERFLDEQG